ncbi:MATE family efflux transporter [Microbacterium plantarum]|uniref:hypothetical protein n=1 Tax=Microbacterium plantarum TaxID=1816425 RepID=UPI002B4A8885|nr:hypothetical protein [Microbacterium plantarum]WRK16647.1 hypothetical protein VC184_12110 [Microbacterium plantarum]
MASALGAVAAFVFQIVTARSLGTADFGLLAAFFSIVNVAAIGSSAVQNSVAVETAAAPRSGGTGLRRQIPTDALVIGVGGGLLVAALAPWIADALGANLSVVFAAAATIPLSFLFASFVGRVQGSGRAAAAVGWSTASLVLRVLFVAPLMLLGLGVGGAAGAVLAATGIATIGAALAARSVPGPTRTIFTGDGATIVTITVALAWLTSADVFFLRMLAPADVAGSYASVAVLVKAAFILPSTLSLYLLPRFARNRGHSRLTWLGVGVSVLASAGVSLLLLVIFAVAGGPIIDLLYGPAYASAVSLLVPVVAAYIPWIILQGLLIQLIADASRLAAVSLCAAVVVQALAFVRFLPDVAFALTAFGVLGAILCAVLIVVVVAKVNRSGRSLTHEQSS